MKRSYTLILVILLVWNSLLTFNIVNLRQNQSDKDEYEQEQNPINTQVVTNYVTEATKIVDDNKAKLVEVVSGAEGSQTKQSGSVISADETGTYIMTPASTLAEGTLILLTFKNGQQLQAELLGKDVVTDLALLKVQPEFTVDPLIAGDSFKVNQGEYSVALGSDGASFGIIAQNRRTVWNDTNQDGNNDWAQLYLETDAAVNQMNNGGALFNLAGECIGLLTNKNVSGRRDGIYLVNGIQEVLLIGEHLKQFGQVYRLDLGLDIMEIESMTTYQKSALGIQIDQLEGVVVTHVDETSPLVDQVAVGDIITRINNEKIIDLKSYRKQLYPLQEVTSLELTVLRQGELMKVTVVLA